jgi:hypothetical protein
MITVLRDPETDVLTYIDGDGVVIARQVEGDPVCATDAGATEGLDFVRGLMVGLAISIPVWVLVAWMVWR